MAKIKPYHLHRIKIHPNRWLIWAIAYAIIVAIGMVGYIKVTDVNFDSQVAAENQFQPWRSYTNQALGFSLRYPGDWSIESTSKNAVNFIPAASPSEGVSISTSSPTVEKSLRKALNIIAEKSVMVDGAKGSEITNDLGNGALETVILAKHNNKLYVLSGEQKFVRQFLLTFRFAK